MSSLQNFLTEGVFKYGEAVLAVESFETAMGEHLASILQMKDGWGPFRKKQRKDAIDWEKSKQAGWGRWVQAWVDGKLNESKDACIVIGLWWGVAGKRKEVSGNAVVDDQAGVLYAHFDSPNELNNFDYVSQDSRIRCETIGDYTYLFLDPEPNIDLKASFHLLLEELLKVPSLGKTKIVE